MKRYIYLLAIAALAAFGCTVTGPEGFGVGDYAGNKVKVTAPEAIPAQGGTVTAVVKTFGYIAFNTCVLHFLYLRRCYF